jgi:hypothetical protein
MGCCEGRNVSSTQTRVCFRPTVGLHHQDSVTNCVLHRGLDVCCVQEEVDKVLQRAHWDDESEMWVLEHLSDTHPAAPLLAGGGGANSGSQQLPYGLMPGSSRPYAVPGLRRPVSAFTKAALMSGDMNPRFRWVFVAARHHLLAGTPCFLGASWQNECLT